MSSWCHPLPLMPKGERDLDGSMPLGGAWVVVINDKGGGCCCRLSLMPTPDWWLSLMTTTVMWSLLTWWWPLQWSQYDAARLMLVDMMNWWWSHEDPNDVMEPMMLTHDDDGDRAILEMPWWCLLMIQPLEMVEPCWMPWWRWYIDDDCMGHDDEPFVEMVMTWYISMMT